MPFFQYIATDKTGKRVEGTLQSGSSDAARQALMRAGMSTVDVFLPKSKPAPAPVQVRPAVTAFPQEPVPTLARTATPQPKDQPADEVKTPAGRDGDLYFLLTQLSGMQTAGIAPSSFLQHMADRSAPAYRESLLDAGKRVALGESLSDCFERYPNLYPKHVVGHVRVGEKSGYLAEGVTQAADSVHRAHRLKRRLAYFPIVAGAMLVLFPLSHGLIAGSLASMKAQDKAGGSLPVYGTIWSGVVQSMKTWGFVALAVFLVLFAIIKLWNLPALRLTRHRLGYWLFKGRARAEAVTRLSWGISRTTKADIPYYAAYQLAAECIPNEFLRANAIAEAAKAREGEPLSAAMRRSFLLPQQYADVVETGEITGDVPKAMDQLAQYASSDFEGADTGAFATGSIVLYIFLGILTLILVVSLAMAYYGGILEWGLSDEFAKVGVHPLARV